MFSNGWDDTKTSTYRYSSSPLKHAYLQKRFQTYHKSKCLQRNQQKQRDSTQKPLRICFSFQFLLGSRFPLNRYALTASREKPYLLAFLSHSPRAVCPYLTRTLPDSAGASQAQLSKWKCVNFRGADPWEKESVCVWVNWEQELLRRNGPSRQAIND